MRLDKFLKDSRLIKRRTIAKEVCTAGKVQINGKVAKASSEVAVGDELTINFAKSILVVKVESLVISSSKALAGESYSEVMQTMKAEANNVIN